MRPLSHAAILILVSAASMLARAQQPAPPAGPAAEAAPGQGSLPDFSKLPSFAPPPEMNPTAPKAPPPVDPKLKAWDGIWTPEGPLPGADGAGVPFTDEWEKKLADHKSRAGANEDRSNWSMCVPQGPPLIMSGAFDLVVRPGAMNIFTMEHGFEYRHIFVDGRDHTPEDFLFDTYGGESVGKWEGDTLVVDTKALYTSNEIIPGVPGSSMHVVERYAMRADGKLQIQFTVEDEETLTEPWVYTRVYARSKLPGLPENYCIFAPKPEDPDALKALDSMK